MSTRSLAVMQALKARAERIRTANGFATEAGANVYLGREDLFAEDLPVPCITIIEGVVVSSDDKQPQRALYVVNQPISIVGLTESDPNNPLVAGHQLLADLLRAVFQVRDPASLPLRKDTLDGLVRELQFDSYEVVPRDDGGRVTCAVLTVRPVFSLNAAHPDQ